MSHTNSTPNYNLPQFIGSDIPDWLTDVNKGYSDIDAGMQANKMSASTANEKANNNTTSIQLLNERVDNISNDLGDVNVDTSSLKQTVELHTTHLNEIDTINNRQSQDITELQTTQTEQGQDILAIQANADKVPVIEQNINTLTSSVSAAETEIDSLGDRVDSIESDIPLFAQKYTLEKVAGTVTPSTSETFSVSKCDVTIIKNKSESVIGWFISELDLNNLQKKSDGKYTFNIVVPSSDLSVATYIPGVAQLRGASSDYTLNSPVIWGLGNYRGATSNTVKTVFMYIPDTESWNRGLSVSIQQKIIL